MVDDAQGYEPPTFEDDDERKLWLSFFEEGTATEADEALAEVRKRSGPSLAHRIVEMLRETHERTYRRLCNIQELGNDTGHSWTRICSRSAALDEVRQKAEAMLP